MSLIIEVHAHKKNHPKDCQSEETLRNDGYIYDADCSDCSSSF